MTTANFKLGYGDYLRFRDLVNLHSGLYFPDKKRIDLEIGLGKAMESASINIRDANSYYKFLSENSSSAAHIEMKRLINILTIGETHFFRDSAQFDALANHVLPEIIQRKRLEAAATGTNPSGAPHLRIWDAGCATGEESYSLAILLRELIPDIQDWHILILATDINEDSLTRARKGVYSNWSFREERARSMRHIYFTPQPKRHHLHDDIRQMVTFFYHNLIKDDFPAFHNNLTAMDMIICRNVTIYFNEETTNRLVQKFYDTLLDDGWLIVGHSEPSLLTYRSFQVRTFPGAILYHKTGTPSEWPDDWEPVSPQMTPTKPLPQETATAPLPPAIQKIQPRPAKSATKVSVAQAPAPPRRTGFLTLPDGNSNTKRNQPEDVYHQARQMLSDGRIDDTIQLLEGGLNTLSPELQPYAYCLLARAHADQGSLATARLWCQKAIKLNNLLSEPYFVLALIDETEANNPQAIKNLKKVIYLDRQRPLAHFNLAMLFRKMGQIREAKRAFKNVTVLLAQWPADKPIPDSGGTSAQRLLSITQKALKSLAES